MSKKRVSFAMDLIVEQGNQIAEALGSDFTVTEKSPKDYVTDVDQRLEEQIDNALEAEFPNDGFFGEEGRERTSSSGYEWIIDPVDGTNNFTRNIPWVGMNIALLHKDKVVAGLIYQPSEGKLFWSELGKGSYVRDVKDNNDKGVRLKVSENPLSRGILIYESAIVRNRERSHAIFKDMLQVVDQVRMPGVAAYEWMLIAAGAADILAYDQPKAVDVAAGTLILEEAGGVVTDFEGKPWSRHMNGILAGNPVAHKEALEIVRKYAELD